MVALLAMTALPTGLAAAAPVGPFNPVVGNNGFLVVASGNATVTNNENEGTMALGGNLTIGDSYRLFLAGQGGATFNGDAHPTAVVVGGRVDLAGSAPTAELSVLSSGYIKIGDLTGVTVRNTDNNNASVNTHVVPAPGTDYDAFPRISMTVQQPIPSVGPASVIDFPGLFSTYEQRSTDLATCANTVVLTDANGSPLPEPIAPGTVAFVHLTAGVTNVLIISATDLNNIATLTFPTAPNASTPLLINVSTTGVGGEGNIVVAGYSQGTVANNGGEVHAFPFSTTVACESPTASPTVTPTTPTPTPTVAPTTVVPSGGVPTGGGGSQPGTGMMLGVGGLVLAGVSGLGALAIRRRLSAS